MSVVSSSGSVRRTSVSTKIIFIVAIFSLPIGVLAYLLASVYTPQIASTELELAGNSLQKPLMRAMGNAWIAESVADNCGSRTDCGAALMKQAAETKAALAQAEATNAPIAQDLQTTLDALTKKQQTELSLPHLQAKLTALAGESGKTETPEERQQLAKGYDWLANRTKDFISYQGNTSNLILDPDLDSYYQVDVTLLAMPDMMSHIHSAASLSHELSTTGTDAVTQAALDRETDALEDGLKRIEQSNATSFDADAANHGTSPTLRPKLTDAFATYKSAIQNYTQTLRKAKAQPGSVNPNELAKLGERAQTASLTYWEVAATELDILLNARIADFEMNRSKALGFSALAVLVAAVIAFLLGRSISRPLEELVRSLGPGATLLGSSVERIARASQTESTDPMESAIICEELNAHADSMRKAVMELARHVQGNNAQVGSDAELSRN